MDALMMLMRQVHNVPMNASMFYAEAYTKRATNVYLCMGCISPLIPYICYSSLVNIIEYELSFLPEIPINRLMMSHGVLIAAIYTRVRCIRED
jgi:hypothetical protein